MNDWKKVRRRTAKSVRGGLEQARRYARRLEEETQPQRRRLTAEARRRAPGFAAFAIATALELMSQRRPAESRPGAVSRFVRTAVLVAVAALIASLFLKRKR